MDKVNLTARMESTGVELLLMVATVDYGARCEELLDQGYRIFWGPDFDEDFELTRCPECGGIDAHGQGLPCSGCVPVYLGGPA